MEILLFSSENLEEFENFLIKINEKHEILDVEPNSIAGCYFARITIKR
ncbi:MAG: hypothetical protein ACRCY7_07690 [Cetobacterium sp.]